MNIADIVVIILLCVTVAAIIIYMIRCKKKGKSVTCSGDCSNCNGCNKK